MKTAIVLVLNLPLILIPAACSRRLPSDADGAEAFGETAGPADNNGQTADQEVQAGWNPPEQRDGAAESRRPPEITQADDGLEAIRQKVRQMKPEQLLEVAKECGQRLAETEDAIRPIARRLQATSTTDRLSPEAQRLTRELMKLQILQTTLRKELEIYTAGLKAYGIDQD